jgi:murein DD-endopeptidase MepM/ murein hydrolase activator NlpD
VLRLTRVLVHVAGARLADDDALDDAHGGARLPAGVRGSGCQGGGRQRGRGDERRRRADRRRVGNGYVLLVGVDDAATPAIRRSGGRARSTRACRQVTTATSLAGVALAGRGSEGSPMRRVRVSAGASLVACTVMLATAQPASGASASVAALQAALKSIGLYPIAVDGVRGPFTARGVRRFQRRRGLLVDGIAGPHTRRALGRLGRPRLGARVIRQGAYGWDVAALQFLLWRRGYSPGGIDLVFGPATRNALALYQRAAGLVVDGLAGPATIASLRGRGGTPVSTGGVRFYRPVPGPIGDGFGAPREGGRRHAGIDFPVPYGTLVAAAGVGTTIFAGYNREGYGNLVVIQHRLGYTSWYAHLSQITTWVGERVSGGTRIGYVGATGHATGPHLHFEVHYRNVPIDPAPLLLGPAALAARVDQRLRCREPAAYRTARIDDCRSVR